MMNLMLIVLSHLPSNIYVHGVNAVFKANCWGVSFQVSSHVKSVLHLAVHYQNSTMVAKLNGRWHRITMIFLIVMPDNVIMSLVMDLSIA